MTQIQNVLDSTLSKCPNINDLLVQVEGQEIPIPLVKHVNIVLDRVVKETNTLLKRHSQLPVRWGGKYLSWTLKSLKLSLEKETIVSMLESVEQAHHHLHMALMLASLSTSSTW